MRNRISKIIKLLNKFTIFNRFFYLIHENIKDRHTDDSFLAIKLRDEFWIGSYENKPRKLWLNIINGNFENSETAIFKKLISTFDYFIDIGAHIGYYSSIASSINPNISIIAFEPNPDNFKSLEINLRMNSAKNPTVFNIGLGEKKGRATLFGVDSGGIILRNTGDALNSNLKRTSISIDILDNYTQLIPASANVFVKMDVENYEFMVLRGAKTFLQKIKPACWMVELCRYNGAEENKNFFNAISIFTNVGYNAYIINNNSEIVKVSELKDCIGGQLFIYKK